ARAKAKRDKEDQRLGKAGKPAALNLPLGGVTVHPVTLQRYLRLALSLSARCSVHELDVPEPTAAIGCLNIRSVPPASPKRLKQGDRVRIAGGLGLHDA